MTTIHFVWPLLLAFIISATITWRMRVYALRHAVLDIPNERSSHSIPTPRGGGVAIVLTFIAALLYLQWIGSIETNLLLALLGGVAIAFIGYCDDVYTVKATWRISIHFIAAIWAVYWLHGFTVLDLGPWRVPLFWAGPILATTGIVWCINFYNFMDGIDGLAGGEALFVSVASGLALFFVGAPHFAIVLGFLAAASAGFLLWNWPPAKIFLGDIGSGFLGYTFAVLGLATVNQSYLPVSFWGLLLAIFLCDATFTLLARFFAGKRWFAAHREHAYQRLIISGANHKQVTLLILAMNCCLLLPAAFAIIYWPKQALWLFGSILLCLWFLWFRINHLADSE